MTTSVSEIRGDELRVGHRMVMGRGYDARVCEVIEVETHSLGGLYGVEIAYRTPYGNNGVRRMTILRGEKVWVQA